MDLTTLALVWLGSYTAVTLFMADGQIHKDTLKRHLKTLAFAPFFAAVAFGGLVLFTACATWEWLGDNL